MPLEGAKSYKETQLNIQSLGPIIRSSYFWQLLQGLQATALPKKKITTDVVDISPEVLRLSREGIPPIGESARSGTSTDGYPYNRFGKKQSARK